MVYQIADVMRDVRVCLDQNMSSDALLTSGDIDTLSVDDIIRSKIPEAVERVHKSAPLHLLEEGHIFGDVISWGDKESGRVLLPQDFMRLITFKMSDWERSVHTAISAGDPEYELQRQRIKALRGTAQKPVCAIVNRQEGKVLEFYSCKSEDAEVVQAQYIPYPEVDAYGGIDISERCYPAVVYTAASLVSITLGEAEKSTVLAQTAQTYLQ